MVFAGPTSKTQNTNRIARADRQNSKAPEESSENDDFVTGVRDVKICPLYQSTQEQLYWWNLCSGSRPSTARYIRAASTVILLAQAV
jgi:hypothetical protein